MVVCMRHRRAYDAGKRCPGCTSKAKARRESEGRAFVRRLHAYIDATKGPQRWKVAV